MTTNHQKGSLRDREILRSIELQTALDADQIRLLHLQNISYGMACRKLRRMAERKIVQRDRLSANEPYFYYLNKRPGQVEHILSVSWVYVWTIFGLRNYQKLHCFQREVDYKILRSDAFVGIKNTWTNKMTFGFVEMDIAESGNPFKKASLYNRLFSDESYLNEWWVPLTERFPPIVVVTTGNIKKLQERIDAENENGLEFKLYSLSAIKEECLNGCSSYAGIRA